MLILSYAAMMSLAVAVNLMPVFLTTLGADLGGGIGLDHEQLGRIGAVTFAGLVLAILATGPLADRWGAKPFAVGGNLLIAVGLALAGVAHSYPVLLASVAVMGVGAGALDMVLSPIVCALRPERRSAAMNWLHAFYCIGAVGTVLVAAGAMRLGLHWRTIALCLVPMPFVVAAGFLRAPLPALVLHEEGCLRVRDLVRLPVFLAALGAIFLAGATELGLAQWLPAYAENELGYSRWFSGTSLLLFSLAMTAGRLLAGSYGGRVRPARLMTACCVATFVLYMAACFGPWSGTKLTAAILTGLTGSCLWPTMLALAADRFPRGGAGMFGLLAAFGNFGGILMPWIVGVMADVTAMHWGLAMAALCPLGLIVLLRYIESSSRGNDV